MPGVVVLPSPKRQGYTYQALKPAVIVLCDDNLEDDSVFKAGEKELLLEHIKLKQEQIEEQKRAKRALSAMPEKREWADDFKKET